MLLLRPRIFRIPASRRPTKPSTQHGQSHSYPGIDSSDGLDRQSHPPSIVSHWTGGADWRLSSHRPRYNPGTRYDPGEQGKSEPAAASPQRQLNLTLALAPRWQAGTRNGRLTPYVGGDGMQFGLCLWVAADSRCRLLTPVSSTPIPILSYHERSIFYSTSLTGILFFFGPEFSWTRWWKPS